MIVKSFSRAKKLVMSFGKFPRAFVIAGKKKVFLNKQKYTVNTVV